MHTFNYKGWMGQLKWGAGTGCQLRGAESEMKSVKDVRRCSLLTRSVEMQKMLSNASENGHDQSINGAKLNGIEELRPSS